MSPRIIQLLTKPKSSAIGIASRFILWSKDIVIQHNIPYDKHRACKLDIYSSSSAQNDTLKPALIVIHGGGWIAGDKRERALFCAALAREGHVVFNVNYRLAPQFPLASAIDDCSSALRWVYVHTSEYGANPQNISVIGDSAGAHLASLAIKSQPYIKRLVLYYGIYNLKTVRQINRPFLRTYLQALNQDSIITSPSAISPISFIQNLPPTLLIASEKDPLHLQTLEFARAIHKKGHTQKVLLLDQQNYPRATHGFQNLPHSKAAKVAFSKVIDFLNTP